jgi:hypothetical protein
MKTVTKVLGVISGMGAFMLTILAAVAVIAGFCWDYMFSMWLPYMDLAHNVPFWVCMIMGFVPIIGWIAVPGWFVTWVLFSFILV